MNGVARIAALVGAVAYIAAAQLEMFFFDRPAARRILHVDAHDVAELRMWAFVVGFRNTLAGVATVLGVADALGYWRPRGGSVVGTIGSSLPPLVVLLASL